MLLELIEEPAPGHTLRVVDLLFPLFNGTFGHKLSFILFLQLLLSNRIRQPILILLNIKIQWPFPYLFPLQMHQSSSSFTVVHNEITSPFILLALFVQDYIENTFDLILISLQKLILLSLISNILTIHPKDSFLGIIL